MIDQLFFTLFYSLYLVIFLFCMILKFDIFLMEKSQYKGNRL